jgi:hypothetical protein
MLTAATQSKKPTVGFLFVQIKIKSFSSLYLYKIIVYLKKSFALLSKLVFLPAARREVVVLRSPFVYKSSRLKFRFSTNTILVCTSFFIPIYTKVTAEQLKKLLAELRAATFSGIYQSKKKYQNYYF